MSLIDSSYGKTNVKFLKVKRDKKNPKIQEILQANCQVLLRGNFDVSYTEADNAPIVPTDTVKNTVLIEAKNTEVWPIERFAAHLAKHFTTKYNHVSGVEVTIIQDLWKKYEVNGKLHDHSFRHEGFETRRTFLTYDKPSQKTTIVSGIKDLKVLKSTGSMFYGYHDCDYTTLKPTEDRILSTDVDASWKFELQLGSLDDIMQRPETACLTMSTMPPERSLWTVLPWRTLLRSRPPCITCRRRSWTLLLLWTLCPIPCPTTTSSCSTWSGRASATTICSTLLLTLAA